MKIKRYAQMNDDIVINVSLWNQETMWNPGCEIVELEDNSPIGPGWSRKNGDWIAPLQSDEKDDKLE